VTYEQLKNLFGIDANKMLQGYSIAGVQGNIVPRPNENMTTEIVDIGWTNPKKVGFRFPPGYYPQVGQYQPIVEVNYGELASRIGVRADKMLNDTNILGVQGQIKIINTQNGNYRINKSAAFGIDGWSDVHNPVFWIDFPHGNGFYCRNDNHPHVCIDAVNLGTAGADSVLSGQTATSVQGVKFAGAIPRWICTTGDVISAVNGEGFVWDDTYAGRGRGIVMKIPNKHFIQDANYAFLASPNLYPQNIRSGVNINGITGTMPDYSTGRTVFNGATFDNVLVSGVATKGFSHNGVYYAYVLQSGYGYGGIYGGGMNLQISTGYPALRSRRIGCVLSQSINVTPFRQIVVYYRSVANIQGSPYVSLEAHIIRASARGRVQIGDQLVDTVDVIRQGTTSPVINREGQIVLNVGDINEQVFLSFGAFCNQDKAGDVFSGAVQITRIDFAN